MGRFKYSVMLQTFEINFFALLLFKVRVIVINISLGGEEVYSVIHALERSFIFHKFIVFLPFFSHQHRLTIVFILHVRRGFVESLHLLRSLTIALLHNDTAIFTAVVFLYFFEVRLMGVGQSDF